MPLIQILSNKRKEEHQRPPAFSAAQRKSFFRLPLSLQKVIEDFRTTSHKVRFRLMFGYFLYSKKFFAEKQYVLSDIKYLCGQYGVLPFVLDEDQYGYSSYHRHKKVILDHFSFSAYDTSVHDEDLLEAITDQVYSWEPYDLVYEYAMGWLEHRRIEKPGYYRLQYIITKCVRNRDKQIDDLLIRHLTQEQKTALNQLLKTTSASNDFYVLTSLQRLHPSHAPKHIRANIEKLQLIQEIYKCIHPLLVQLDLNSNAIRRIGKAVCAENTYKLLRKGASDRYFGLAVFTAYQLSVFEDWMARTLIIVCQLATNQASRNEKDKVFQEKEKKHQIINSLFDLAQNKISIIKEIREIVWKPISAEMKEKELQQLLPKEDNLLFSNNADELPSDDMDDTTYYDALATQSVALQRRANPIISQLSFEWTNTPTELHQAIQHFKNNKGIISKEAPQEFLSSEDREALLDNGKFKVSLYKILLFQSLSKGLKNGTINLKYSHKYKAFQEYLIPMDQWNSNKKSIIDRANLSEVDQCDKRLTIFKKVIHDQYTTTNERVMNGENQYFRSGNTTPYYITTTRVDSINSDIELLPKQGSIPLSQILATINSVCSYTDALVHTKTNVRTNRPPRSTFLAGIIAFGCNLGIRTMMKVTSDINGGVLKNVFDWYFDPDHIHAANDVISECIATLPISKLFQESEDTLHTSSDGQKIKLISDRTIFANYSAKYFNKGKGVSSYSFIDERGIPFYSTIIDSSVREASYVLDGLLHNDTIRSTIHTTDTHGYTEALFGLMDLLGFGFNPNIAKIYRQSLYTFKTHKLADYQSAGYTVKPIKYINEKLIKDNWSAIMHLVASLKLKHCKASDVFLRLNSYSRQHPLYAALKEYGRILKTLHVLKYIDDHSLRQQSRKSANRIELSNSFSSAVFFANGGEMIFLTREEQQKAEACKRLIKNAIVCWNYLYLTRKIQNSTNPQSIIKNLKNKSMMAWAHVYFNGTYDFSDENTSDQFHILSSQNFDL